MSELSAALKVLLANHTFMYYKIASYHWNVEGLEFSQFHDFYGDLYADTLHAGEVIYDNLSAVNATITNLTVTTGQISTGNIGFLTTDIIVGTTGNFENNRIGKIIFEDYPGQSALDFYKHEAIITTAAYPDGHNSSITITYTRVGTLVTLRIDSFTHTIIGPGGQIVIGVLPSILIPDGLSVTVSLLLNNNIAEFGLATIDNLGHITLSPGTSFTSNFTGNSGLPHSLCLSYTIY